MPRMRFLSEDPREIRIEASLWGETREVYVRCSEPVLVARGEALLALSTYLGIAMEEPIEIEAGISPQVLSRWPEICEIFELWEMKERRPELKHLGASVPSTPEERGAGLFFSGGVDAAYSLARHSQEVDTLVFVSGFDTKLPNLQARAARMEKIKRVADVFDKRLIEIETDLKRVLLGPAGWQMGHGSIMAALAHLLSGHLREMTISASMNYLEVTKWGSHPLLDPLWSSEAMTLRHLGLDRLRGAKLQVLAEHPVLLDNLQVCWAGEGDTNCGRCEKCMRTMISLRSIGKLEGCKAFEAPLDLRRARFLKMYYSGESNYQEYLRYALERGDTELARVIETILRQPYRKGVWAPLRNVWRHFRAQWSGK